MISVKLKKYQTLYEFVDLVEAYRAFNQITDTYSIEIGQAPRYIIETYNRDLLKFIRANVDTNKIHRNEDR